VYLLTHCATSASWQAREYLLQTGGHCGSAPLYNNSLRLAGALLQRLRESPWRHPQCPLYRLALPLFEEIFCLADTLIFEGADFSFFVIYASASLKLRSRRIF
jgi:hypothetical protein